NEIRARRGSPDTFAQDSVDVDPETTVSVLAVPLEDGADLVQSRRGVVALHAHIVGHAGPRIALPRHDPRLLLPSITLCVDGVECAMQSSECKVGIGARMGTTCGAVLRIRSCQPMSGPGCAV